HATSVPIPPKQRSKRRAVFTSWTVEKITRRMEKTSIFLICGSPCRGLGEKTSDSTVPVRNRARGSHMRGRRSLSREVSSAPNERTRSVCDAVIDIRMITADAKARQYEVRKRPARLSLGGLLASIFNTAVILIWRPKWYPDIT